MKFDDEIDKLFKDKLENSSIPDIPQAYLDDMNKRLDAISPPIKKGKSLKGNSFLSSGFIATVSISLVIVAFVIYSNVFNKQRTNKSEKDQNSSEEISAIKEQKNVTTEQTSADLNNNAINENVENENSTGTGNSSINSDNSISGNLDISSEQNSGKQLNEAAESTSSVDKESRKKSLFATKNASAKNSLLVGTAVTTKNGTAKNAANRGKANSNKKEYAVTSSPNASISELSKTNVNDFTYNKDSKSESRVTKASKDKSVLKAKSNVYTNGASTSNTSPFENNGTSSLNNTNEKKKGRSPKNVGNTQKSAAGKTKNNINKVTSQEKNLEGTDSVMSDKPLKTSMESKKSSTKNKVVDAKKSALTGAATGEDKELNKKNNVSGTDSAKLAEGQTMLSDKKDLAINKTTADSITKAEVPDSVNTNKKLETIASNAATDSLKNKKSDSIALAAKDSVKQALADITKKIVDSTKNSPKGSMSVQVLVGYSKINSTFKSKNPEYDTKRKNEESPIQAFDASLLFSSNRNRFVYTAGFNYSQWGEKINYSASIDSVQYINRVDTSYVTQQIDSVTFVVNPVLHPVYANKGVTNNETTVHNGKNTYSYLSIPFLFGYQFGIPAFSITPKIGGTIGIPLKSKGYYVSSDSKTLVQEKAAAWLFNCQFSLDLETKVSPYISVCISPVYRYALTPLIHSANTTNRYSSLGVQIGAAFTIH